MSKLVKSSRITIDKKKYILNNEFFMPVKKDKEQKDIEREDASEELDDDAKIESVDPDAYHNELRLMKEQMLEAVKIESDSLFKNAQDEKTQLIQEAYDQVDTIRKNAQKEGYDIGYEEGIANGYEQVSDLIDEALAEKEKYYDKYRGIKEESETAITEVIIQTVEKILNKHVEDDYEIITGLVEIALEKCAFTTNLTLRVSPEDYDNAISIRRYILSLTENVEHIEIKQDVALKPGSCIFDTDAGSVDSSVHTQFENVRLKFIELLQSE